MELKWGSLSSEATTANAQGFAPNGFKKCFVKMTTNSLEVFQGLV